MNHLKTITLKATKGTQTIANAKDVFTGYIDSDFVNWKLDQKEKPTKAMKLAVCEMTENGTYKQIFTDPEKMWVTQDQVIEFVKSHKEDLQQSWYTFFLIKRDSDFFVVGVSLYSVLRPGVHVRGFADACVWRAEYRRRFVLPQLALENSESVTLRPSETLTLESAIKMVKKEGYVIYKPI